MKHSAKAMVFKEIEKPFSPSTIKIPKPQSGQMLVEIDFSTICTSDLHTFYGRRASPCPCILGHEIMGRVVQVGPGGIRDFSGNSIKKGDRITWSVYAYERNDLMALNGFPQKSASLYKYGHEELKANSTLNGGFATHCLLREGTCVYILPNSISDKEAAPLNCSHATIAGALRLTGSVKDKNVAVIGTGMLGLVACAMARENGASNVLAIDLKPKRLEKSLEFGANATLNALKNLKDWSYITETLGGLDIIIDTSGNPEAIENGISLLNIGGTCVIVGAVYTERNLSINAENIVRRLLTIKGLHNYIPEDLYLAIRFMIASKNKYPFESLIGAVFPLNELNHAFDLANQGDTYRVGIRPNT